VEADETFIGRQEGQPKRRAGRAHKISSHSCRAGRRARSFHVDSTTVAQMAPIVRANIAKETALMTDEARQLEPSSAAMRA
jgi:hypothetical protein